MDNSNAPVFPNVLASKNFPRSGSWMSSVILLGALGLITACDRRSESNPGSTPAAIGSGSTSSGRSDAGTSSSGVEVRTPVAPDIRGGGSTGPQGVPPAPDTSGAPSSGSNSPGASNRGAASTTTNSAPTTSATNSAQDGGTVRVTPPEVSSNGGLPASALGNSATSNGNTNSTPQSSTGSR